MSLNVFRFSSYSLWNTSGAAVNQTRHQGSVNQGWYLPYFFIVTGKSEALRIMQFLNICFFVLLPFPNC